ncbi:hypothetical protein MMC28_008168 [Mycoblastus sanguinarius]|nr:hypothetical protein [Mycoblastus sanguinarius]
MPTYAILGATGSTGSSLLRYLHDRPDKVNISIYARSASKVESLHPYVKDAKNVQIFVGDLSSVDLLKDCLRGADVIFSAVAQNANEPGCSIARRTANTIVSTLEVLRKEEGSNFKCPILVFLSSASLNPQLSKNTPLVVQQVVHWVLERGCYYVYGDLAKAIGYLKQQKWVPLITAEPPGLVKDISRGFELSLEEVSAFISYDDLARGMVQMAEDDGGRKWVGKGVGIKSTGAVKQDVWPLIKFQVAGLIAYFLPAVWRAGNGRLW